MMSNLRFKSRRAVASVVLAILVSVLCILPVTPVWADDKAEAEQLVDKARVTFESLTVVKDMEALVSLVKKAKGVLIYPSVLRGAFIFGASGGTGTFLVYDASAKKWGGPAFYTLGDVSFGLQIGGDASEIVLVAMSDRGVSALQSASVKLGADASVAAGPVGVGAAAATQGLSADIISFSRAKGAYAGISLSGAVVGVRGSLNEGYYGKKEITPTDILIKRTVHNPHSAGLIGAVSKVAGH